jgi:hypothetical protein
MTFCNIALLRGRTSNWPIQNPCQPKLQYAHPQLVIKAKSVISSAMQTASTIAQISAGSCLMLGSSKQEPAEEVIA